MLILLRFAKYFSRFVIITKFAKQIEQNHKHILGFQRLCYGYHEFTSVLEIRIRMFLGLPDPDPLVRGTDPDPSLFS